MSSEEGSEWSTQYEPTSANTSTSITDAPSSAESPNTEGDVPADVEGSYTDDYCMLEVVSRGPLSDVGVLKKAGDEPLLILKSASQDLDTRKYIENELQILRRLQSVDGVSKLYSQHLCEGSLQLCFIEGDSLDKVVGQWYDMSTRLEIMLQVAQIVAEVHSHGIVHGDLKPANIMITEHSWPISATLIDFGSAGFNNKSATISTMSHGYTAPEAAQAAKRSIVSDIWSYGCTMATLLTNVPPYNSENPQAPFSVAQLCCEASDCPPHILALILTCFNIQSPRPTAKEIVEVLQSPPTCTCAVASKTPRDKRWAQCEQLCKNFEDAIKSFSKLKLCRGDSFETDLAGRTIEVCRCQLENVLGNVESLFELDKLEQRFTLLSEVVKKACDEKRQQLQQAFNSNIIHATVHLCPV